MLHHYVGPPDLAAAAPAAPAGRPIRSAAELDAWLAEAAPHEAAEPFTYVVDAGGTLLLAPRRSEHVACAGGGPVHAAGEIAFARAGGAWAVAEVTNQSTGYAPDPACWPAVAAALDAAGVAHPGGFTAAFVFRRCPGCAGLVVVKDADFTCPACDTELPAAWNAGASPPP